MPRSARWPSPARAAHAARSRSGAARRARPTTSSTSSPRWRPTPRRAAWPCLLPTRRGGHGALVAWRTRPGAFSAREQELAEAAAAHAATVLAGARGAMRGLFAREVHHRVKNNLQTVASLLRLAASGGADPERALRDSIGRVLAIAEVHDLLTAHARRGRRQRRPRAPALRDAPEHARRHARGGPAGPDRARARACDGARAGALRAGRQRRSSTGADTAASSSAATARSWS